MNSQHHPPAAHHPKRVHLPVWVPGWLSRALDPIVRQGWGHWMRLFLLLAAGYYSGHLLSEGKWLTELRYDLYYRQLALQHHGMLYPQRTALVLIGDDDYWSDRFERRSPVKRDQLALLLDKLDEAGASMVVLDFDLRSPLPDQPAREFATYAPEDATLLAAVDRMCQRGGTVVLARSLRYTGKGRELEQMPSIYDSAQPQLPCLRGGYLELPFDMRRLPGPAALANGSHLDSLALAAVAVADPTAYDEISHASEEGEVGFRFTRFLTEKDFATRNGRRFMYTSVELRGASSKELHAQFAGRIVLIGAHWHRLASGTGPLIDTSSAPGGELPGVILHANYIEAMLDHTGTFIPISDRTAEILEGLLVVILGIVSVLNVHAILKWGAFFLGLFLSIIFTYLLLQNLGLFLDFAIPLLMIAVHTAVEEILHLRHELGHARHRLKEYEA